MKTFKTRGWLGLLLAASAGLAGAQDPPPPPTADCACRPHERRDPLAELKARLQLQPAQEAAWEAWSAAMAPQRPRGKPPAPPREPATTPERLEQMRALRQVLVADEQRRETATLTFYAALGPEQKKEFDRMPMPPGPPEPPPFFEPHPPRH